MLSTLEIFTRREELDMYMQYNLLETEMTRIKTCNRKKITTAAQKNKDLT